MNAQQQQALAAGLEALAERTRNGSASPRVEQAVLAEMERRGMQTERLGPASPYRFAALAAALLLVVGGAVWTARIERPVAGSIVRPSGFVSLPNAEVLPEMESASIIRVSLPVSALPDYGMAIVPEMTADSVEAELLVAQDGQPRAIRLVNDSDTQRSRP